MEVKDLSILDLKKYLRSSVIFILILLEGIGSHLCHSQSPPSPSSVRIPVTFSAPGKGYVSLALYDQEGVLTRSLLYAKPVEKGRQSVEWDGTTDLGKPASPGSYLAKGVFFTSPPALKYVMEVGKSGN